jgi:Ca2+-transporting ATPase
MFGTRVLAIAGCQGLSSLLAVFGVYLWAVLSDRPDVEVRSVTFAALVIGNVALILVNRSWRLSMWQTFRQRSNPTLKWILSLAAVLLVVLLTVPPLRRAFHFGPMSALDWLVAIAAGCCGVVWFEIYKAIGRHRASNDPLPDRPVSDRSAMPLPSGPVGADRQR